MQQLGRQVEQRETGESYGWMMSRSRCVCAQLEWNIERGRQIREGRVFSVSHRTVTNDKDRSDLEYFLVLFFPASTEHFSHREWWMQCGEFHFSVVDKCNQVSWEIVDNDSFLERRHQTLASHISLAIGNHVE